MPPLLLLLALLVFPCSSTTIMIFRGNITCTLNRPFNYQIQVIEADNFSPDDKISRSSITFAAFSPYPYNITAYDDHDMFERYFQIRFHIFHDCTDNGSGVMMDEEFGYVYIYPGTYYYDNQNFEVTNKGEPSDWLDWYKDFVIRHD